MVKLITLNTWGGRAGKEKILGFIDKNNKVDIFCLQEIWSAPYENLEGMMAGGVPLQFAKIMTKGVSEISSILENHKSYFHPHCMDNFGLQILIKKNLNVKESGDIFVYKERGYISKEDIGDHSRNIQYVTIEVGKKLVTIINFHGLWNGKGKKDSEDRLIQSRKIIEFTKNLKNEFILCGDFNLLPDTESISILETGGLRNLIKDYNIKSTRTSYYKKPEKYADYIFTSKNILVKEFKVLQDEVSDHAPLFLEFDVK